MNFLSENLQFLEVNFSIYLNRHVFVMFFDPFSRYLCEQCDDRASYQDFNCLPFYLFYFGRYQWF